MEVYKFLPKVRGGAQRAEGSVERLTSRNSFRATPEPQDPRRSFVARPPNLWGHFKLVFLV